MNLDTKLVLSNKFVDDFKCENESLKIHAKCLIAKPIVKNEEVICCNHVVKPDFVPIVSSTSKDKSVYKPPRKRNQKVERKTFKPKPLFRPHPRDLNGSKFVPTCDHCSVIGHIIPKCFMLKREQNHVVTSLPKKPSGPKQIFCYHCGVFGHLRLHCSKFQALKRIKRKEKLELLESCAKKEKPELNISDSHSYKPRLTSHETLIPNTYFVWVRKGSYD